MTDSEKPTHHKTDALPKHQKGNNKRSALPETKNNEFDGASEEKPPSKKRQQAKKAAAPPPPPPQDTVVPKNVVAECDAKLKKTEKQPPSKKRQPSKKAAAPPPPPTQDTVVPKNVVAECDLKLKKTEEQVYTCRFIPGCKHTARWVPVTTARLPLSCTLHRLDPDHGFNWYELRSLPEPPPSPTK